MRRGASGCAAAGQVQPHSLRSRRTRRCRLSSPVLRSRLPAAVAPSQAAPCGATVHVPAVRPHERAVEPVLRFVRLPPRRRCGSGRSPPAAPASTAAPGNVVLTALRADGSEAGTHNLPGGTITVGRETGGIFAGDSHLSPRHATFKQTPGRLTVKDEASLNGVYKKLVRDVPVELASERHVPDRAGDHQGRAAHVAAGRRRRRRASRLAGEGLRRSHRARHRTRRDGQRLPDPGDAAFISVASAATCSSPKTATSPGLHCRLSWENGRHHV